MRAQEEATWGFSRTGQAFHRRVIAPVLEQAGVVTAQAPPPRALPQPMAKSSPMQQGGLEVSLCHPMFSKLCGLGQRGRAC